MESSEWHKGGGSSPPSYPQYQKFSEYEFQSQGYRISISNQKVFGLRVVDSFYKQVSNKFEPIYSSFNILSGKNMSLTADVIIMKNSRPSYLKSFQLANPQFTNSKPYSSELILKNMRPFWRFVFEDKSGLLKAGDVNREHLCEPVFDLGSKLDQVQATIYPKGPLKSHLESVVLDQLLNPTSLISEYLKVSTRSPLPAEAKDNQFNFPIDDSRFYQVQAYYYSSQAIDWFKHKFNLNLPFQINIETSLGYPDKTNTAFYFDKSIRLGDGDDIIFSKIPLDPSIVTHESIHAIIDFVAQLPFDNEGGSINEGLADFFAASILKNPLLGEVSYKKAAFKRSVQNELKFNELNNGLYHDSGIISGLFWNIRQELDDETSTNFAWNALLRSQPKTNFKSFKDTLIYLAQELPSDKQNKILQIMKERAWLD